MDSLLASYASSDEEDNHPQPPHKPPPPPPSSSSFKPTSFLFSSLPKPQLSSSSSSSSKLFSSIPPPKSSSFSSLLPPPISQSNPNPNPKTSGKKVVQFHPPKFNQNLDLRDEDDDEDEDEDEEERERKKARQMGHVTSAKSFLSTIPAPKNSGFSALGGASGGRRTTIDATVTEPLAPDPVVEPNVEGSQVGFDDGSNLYSYDGVSYGNYEGYGQQQYYDGGNSWSYGGNDGVVSGEAVQGTVSSGVDSFVAFGGGGGGGKRRKDQVPAEILEVKQDELMKNRPTEDKSKLTGIAFGPSYQPASSKGKPSKLHKRKHQIGALYFDMRQREMELSERRAKGFLTKAETQAKYGW